MRVSPAMIKTYSRMGQQGAFSGIGMLELAKTHENIRVIAADSVTTGNLDRFVNSYPDKFFNLGICEQNLVGVAAGLASEGGLKVYAYTYAEFIILRALEQIRINLAYQKCNVVLVGYSAGFSMGPLGVSHWAIEDIAALRAMPNITILSAADSLEAIKLAFASADLEGPAYIRLSGGLNCPIVYEQDYELTIGKAVCLREGKSDAAAILATGLMVRQALDAAQVLKEDGIECAVFDFHTIKPLDTGILDELFDKYACIVTIEEHSICGGLGGAVAEYAADKTAPPIVRIGSSDHYVKPASPIRLWEEYGLTVGPIVNTIKKALKGTAANE